MAKKTKEEVVVEDEVTEEVVQAVANAIVEEADERGSDVETIVNEIVEESHDDVQEILDEKETKEESLKFEENEVAHTSTLNYRSRGFETEKDARNFVKTDYFKNLGEADKEEFMAWLKN